MLRSCIVAISALAFTSTSCWAQQSCVPIRFAGGASSATVKGMAPSSERPFACYSLATGRGQTAMIKLTQSNGDTAFNIADLVDNRDKYSFKTEAKTYKIDVYQMKNNQESAPFTMQVIVR